MISATSPSNAFASLIAILLLACVHLLVKELRRLEAGTRYALLAAGAGASLAYVMLRILPKLAEKQDSLLASADTGLRGFLEHHAYLVAMLGLVTYYGISRVAAYGAEEAGSGRRFRAARIAAAVGYGAYSMLIGYLIVSREQFGLLSIVLITGGMGTLFLVTDHGLRNKWPVAYDDWIRWVLAIALVAGWAIGLWVEIAPNIIALWYAFLAGIMLIGVIGEKLAMEESGASWAFLAGVVAFTALLLLLERIPDTAA